MFRHRNVLKSMDKVKVLNRLAGGNPHGCNAGTFRGRNASEDNAVIWASKKNRQSGKSRNALIGAYVRKALCNGEKQGLFLLQTLNVRGKVTADD